MSGRYKDVNKFEEDQRNVDQLSSNFKCHYNENHIFSIEAILKHEQVACMRPSDDVIYSTKFCSNMMKKDISANLYQKCLILCSKIELHNLSLTNLFAWQHSGFQTSPPMLKAFLATLGVQFSYLQMVPDIHDPTSISICQLEFVALYNVFRAEKSLTY